MSEMKEADKERILHAVWDNTGDPTKRYVARAYHNGPAWGAYDKRDECFVDDKLDQIDPNEPLRVQ